MEKYKVKFFPDGKEVEALKGETLLSAAMSAGIYINSSCGGDGVCGRCKVVVRSGAVRAEPSGRITPEEKKQGYVLGCLATVEGDAEIEIPASSRLVGLDKVEDEKAKFLRLKGMYSEAEEVDKSRSVVKAGLFTHSPLATKISLEIPPPTLTDNLSDLDRLYREMRRHRNIPIMQIGLANIKRLGALLRQSDWKVTVTVGKRNETTEIVLIEPGDTSARNYGFAFDIGTTTVAGQLINLNSKKVLGTKATHNKQAIFGADVISRIIYASEEDGLERLHHAVIDNINGIIQELIKEHNVNLNDVTAVTVAGNPTMMHLLLRVDPTFIRREPYIPTANAIPVIRAAEAGIKINPRGLLACVPGVSTYVGGDVTAGVLSSGMNRTEDLTMLIDIGTNGEIVLGNRDFLVCCSASAGPCFEGSGVSSGVRATKGAIQKLTIKPALGYDVTWETIAGEKPIGLCGSGLIEAVAELFKHKIIGKNGKIDPSIVTGRIRQSENGVEFVLVYKQDSGVDYDIVITDADIDNIKRGKAAIYAASAILLRRLGMTLQDIKHFYIAGGFGTSLNVEKSIMIGLLPDVERQKFRFIGNSSLAGSREVLLSYDAMKTAEEIAGKMTNQELSVESSYMDEYISALFFPHTDLSRFPGVTRLVEAHEHTH
jgi:uncharacterized 2Fe-2S/4Fe-4S cluster protein (DUF4445 family)